MTGTLESIERAARQLSVQERTTLVHTLLKGLDEPEGNEDEIEALWAAEAEDRLDGYLDGELGGSPLDEVVEKVRARIRK